MMRRAVVLAVVAISVFSTEAGPQQARAQGTKLWTVSRYDEMERGTSDGVAIRSDGRLEPGPATSLLFQTGGNYVWSVAADAAGNAYVGMGGTASGGAVVMKVAGAGGSGAGKAVKIFEGKELGVQALRVGPDGAIYAATSPEGKVYRLGATPADAVVVFDPAATEEKPKYLWDLAIKGNNIYVAAGAPAVVYRAPAGGGKPEVAFKTVDQHVRCLLMSPDGTLWAGTDGNGVIYKLKTTATGAAGQPFAVYSAPKREITALAIDAAGNVYAAGVGAKAGAGTLNGAGLPPLPVTGTVGVTITFSQPGSANAASTNTLIPEGTEIYRISADGSPLKLLALKDDVVYALAFHEGSLLAATGNRGRVYRVDTAMPGGFTDLTHLEASQGMAFAEVPGPTHNLLVATSNSGKVFRLGDDAANATYTSEVFDAQGFAQWGRAEMRSDLALASPTAKDGGYDLFARSGNVESPLMGWSEWTPVAKSGDLRVPGGRYVQWKGVLRPGSSLASVGLNYLQKNIAPVVDEVVVQPGARVAAMPPQPANATVQVVFPVAGPSMQGFVPDPSAAPLAAQKDKSAVTVRWAAHDDNGDDLMFGVWYRGVGERNWHLLKEEISERYLSFDASLLPDGAYEMKVVASDAPVHTDAETLTGERTSGVFVVDTTPPVPGALVASVIAGSGPTKIHATFAAKDATSPIAHAEYSVDAGPWQYLEPVGRVSDSLEEHYDFTVAAPVSTATEQVTDAHEHVLAVRVYDRYDNVIAVKTVIR